MTMYLPERGPHRRLIVAHRVSFAPDVVDERPPPGVPAWIIQDWNRQHPPGTPVVYLRSGRTANDHTSGHAYRSGERAFVPLRHAPPIDIALVQSHRDEIILPLKETCP